MSHRRMRYKSVFAVQAMADDTRDVPEESMMLTQDENIINVEFTVFWRVSDIQEIPV